MRWLLGETADVHVRELVETVSTTAGCAEVNRRRYERALICAGAGTVALAHQVGLPLPARHARHARFSYQVPTGPWPSFIDHQMPIEPLGAYGCLVEYDHYAIGVGWDDLTCATDWTAESTLTYQAKRSDEYRRRAFPEAVMTGTYVTCLNNHWPFPSGRQFAVWEAGNVMVFAGNDLFKFAPLLGQDLADVLGGRSFPNHLASVTWPGVHPAPDGA